MVAALHGYKMGPSHACWTFSCRADIMVQDAEEQIKAALGGNSLEGHCLFVAQGISHWVHRTD